MTSDDAVTPRAGDRLAGRTVVTVVLEREDGERFSFSCTNGQDILAGANAAGCRPRVVCARGGCGACRAVLVEGSVEHRGGFSMSKIQATEPGGAEFVLMCRAAPLEDTVLRPLHRWARRPLSRLSAALPKPSNLPEESEQRQQPGQPGTH